MDKNQRSNKRQKRERGTTCSRYIASLPEVLLKHCLSFVGPGHYRFIAETCRQFRDRYSFPKNSTFKNAAASLQCSKLCENDSIKVPRSFQLSRRTLMQVIARHAIRLGKLDVTKWAVEERQHDDQTFRELFQAAGAGGHLICTWSNGSSSRNHSRPNSKL